MQEANIRYQHENEKRLDKLADDQAAVAMQDRGEYLFIRAFDKYEFKH